MKDLCIGIDIGTSKVGTVVCRINKGNQIEVLGRGIERFDGVKKGGITDVDALSLAISSSVKQAEALAKLPLKSVYVNIPATQVNIISTTGTVNIEDEGHIITQNDVDRVLETVRSLELSKDQVIIDIVPRQFLIDGSEGIKNPIGIKGQRVEVDADVITGNAGRIESVSRALEAAGLDLGGFVAEPIALGEFVLTEEEKQKGVVLLDVGGKMTNISVFKNGELLYSTGVACGGEHVTNDISYGLDVKHSDAEKLKREYEIFNSTAEDFNKEVCIPIDDGSGEKNIKLSEVGKIIQERISEILSLCIQMLKRTNAWEEFEGGVVLTGGGISYVNESVEIAIETFKLPVRVATFDGIDMIRPEYATATSMVSFILNKKMSAAKLTNTAHNDKEYDSNLGIINKIKSFFH